MRNSELHSTYSFSYIYQKPTSKTSICNYISFGKWEVCSYDVPEHISHEWSNENGPMVQFLD